jgi:hypothetical protein
MRTTTIAILLTGAIMALSLGGCMMAVRGALGNGGEQASKAIVKEVEAKDLSLGLEAPPLSAGREARIVARLTRLRGGTPVTGAAVTFTIGREERRGGEFMPLAELEAEEIAGKGVYQLRYKFKDPGNYKITARALTGEGTAADAQSVSLTQEAGKTKTPSLWMILGAAGVIAGIIVKFLIL